MPNVAISSKRLLQFDTIYICAVRNQPVQSRIKRELYRKGGETLCTMGCTKKSWVVKIK